LLQNLSERVRLCYACAAEARERAEATSDAAAKADFFKIERRWWLLARSYEIGVRLDHFLLALPAPEAVAKRELSAPSTQGAAVFVIDDSADVREGVKALVESVGYRCQVFGTAQAFLSNLPEDGPCCLILDVRLPKMSGLDFQEKLARTSRNIPTIIITGHGDIPMSTRAMKAGAVDFLTKPLREQDVLDAINAALNRDRAQLQAEQQSRELYSRLDTLNSREREILPLVTAGRLNGKIADEMGLSEVTVKAYRHNLMAKLKAKTLPDLVRMADFLGIR
jgi:RNA polymerase sigma factor (sigma-70 family)